jgi:hypothetical protein
MIFLDIASTLTGWASFTIGGLLFLWLAISGAIILAIALIHIHSSRRVQRAIKIHPPAHDRSGGAGGSSNMNTGPVFLPSRDPKVPTEKDTIQAELHERFQHLDEINQRLERKEAIERDEIPEGQKIEANHRDLVRLRQLADLQVKEINKALRKLARVHFNPDTEIASGVSPPPAGKKNADGGSGLPTLQITLEHFKKMRKLSKWHGDRDANAEPTSNNEIPLGAKFVQEVMFATNRVVRPSENAGLALSDVTHERSGSIVFGSAQVSIPGEHRIGIVERPKFQWSRY